jgi:hypothetical protein
MKVCLMLWQKEKAKQSRKKAVDNFPLLLTCFFRIALGMVCA